MAGVDEGVWRCGGGLQQARQEEQPGEPLPLSPEASCPLPAAHEDAAACQRVRRATAGGAGGRRVVVRSARGTAALQGPPGAAIRAQQPLSSRRHEQRLRRHRNGATRGRGSGILIARRHGATAAALPAFSPLKSSMRQVQRTASASLAIQTARAHRPTLGASLEILSASSARDMARRTC